MSDYSGGTGIQYHVKTKRGDVGRYCILTGDPGRVSKIASLLSNPREVANNREFVTYTGYLDDTMVSVSSTGIGGPSAAISMQELYACGADTFIRVGTCGGIDLNVMGGDIVIASACVRAEGTAREYASIEYPAVCDVDVLFSLIESARKENKSYHVGVVQCKDSFYGQHDPDKMPVGYKLNALWNEYFMMGCKASEMESATLFIVAQYLKARCGTVLNVIGNQEREKRGMSNPFCHNTENAIETAIEAMCILIANDKVASSANAKSSLHK